MKVHFGGSVSGLKADPKGYRKIRESIIKEGNELLRDWLSIELGGKRSISAQEMFALTEKAINQADSVILESSTDSSAVAKQVLLSLDMDKPVLLLSKVDHFRDDDFIDPAKANLLHKAVYNEKNIRSILKDFFKWVSLNTGLSRFNLEIPKVLDSYLKEKARINLTSKAEEIRKLIERDMKEKRKIKL